MNDLVEVLGSTFRRSKVGVGTIDYASGLVKSLEIPNSLLLKGLVLRLTGNLVVATANASAIANEAPLGLIKNVQIIGDGRRELFNASARRLFRLAHFTWGKQAEISAPSGTIGTRAFTATISIDHEMLQAVNPVESLFDPRVYKQVKINVLWGAASDIATAGVGGTIAISACSLSVVADQTADGVDQILFDHTVLQDEQPVTASSSRFSFKVPQNGLLAGVLIDCTRDTTAVDDLINTISVKSDQTVAHYDNAAWSDLQRESIYKYQIDGGASAGAQIPGYLYLPFMENGMISSALNTNALNNLLLTFNVTRTSGTEIVGVTYDFLEPRRTLAASV